MGDGNGNEERGKGRVVNNQVMGMKKMHGKEGVK